ncbi:hypothetical protein A9Q83_07850 [Alphaproteobacteria bacterium 46_93_T64]|mgnify:CR=1 FL=1|nr:hypothetical protein A9Q83_07850 [Alphaproteobacteria bacterium 46_93_T64]
MQKNFGAPVVGLNPSYTPNISNLQTGFALEAEKLFVDYQASQEYAADLFNTLHPRAGQPEFVPELLDARQVILFKSMRGQKLNLEKLKKEAKSLLKAIKASEKLAVHRITTNHPKIQVGAKELEDLKLTDIQHVLARENGFDSWPKLKHHLLDLETTARFIASGGKIDTPKTAHIRCGNDIGKLLELAGFQGDFHEVIDPFAIGPVFPRKTGEKALAIRGAYIDGMLGEYLPPEEKRSLFEISVKEQTFLESLPANYEEVTLWFEHDAFDQLCLAHIMHHMAEQPLPLSFDLTLVQVDHFPGVKRFLGLGNLGPEPEAISLLYQQRLEITPAMIAFGARVWDAFTSRNPIDLWRLVQETNVPLPLMQNAMRRMLSELPELKSGLGFTEMLALTILKKEGPLAARRVFLFLLAEHDPQPYHGDIMFFGVLKNLWQGERPAIEIVGEINAPGPAKEIVKLTEYGEQLLAGDANWLAANKTTRWVGGVEINSQFEKNWFFDPETGPVLLD